MNLLTPDIELVSKLQAGDAEAFDLIYEKYSEKLYSFGLKYLRQSSEAEELVQTIFLKIWENRKGLKNELSFNSYLFTIAYNEICKLFRKRYHRRQFVDAVLYQNSQSSSSAEEGLDFQSVIDRVEQIIDTLPEKQKLVFMKSRIEGMTTKEIAKELNFSPGTVDNYISETLKFLRKRIHKEDIMLLLFATLFLF